MNSDDTPKYRSLTCDLSESSNYINYDINFWERLEDKSTKNKIKKYYSDYKVKDEVINLAVTQISDIETPEHKLDDSYSEKRESTTISTLRDTIKLPSISHMLKAKDKKLIYNYMFMYTLALSGVITGYMVSIFDTGVFQYDKKATNTMSLEILSYGLFCTGACIGISISNYLVSKFGRRNITIINEIMLVQTISQFWLAEINDNYFIVLRTFVGVGLGVLQHTTVAMFQELVHKRLLPAACILLTVHFSLGGVIPYIMNLFVKFEEQDIILKMMTYSWPGVILIYRIILFAFYYKFDTPAYYMEKSGTHASFEQVKNVLVKFYDKESYPKVHIYLMKEFVYKNPKKYSILGVFGMQYYRRILSGVLLVIVSEIFGANCTMRFVSWMNHEYLSYKNIFQLLLEIIKLVSALLGNIACYFFMTRFGRKKTLMRFYLLQLIILYIICWQEYYNETKFAWYLNFFTCPLLYFAYGGGIGGSFFLLIFEILPLRQIPIILCFKWMVKFGVQCMMKYYEYTYQTTRPENPSWIPVIILSSTLVLFFGQRYYVIETKDKNEEQIIKSYNNLSDTFFGRN